MTVLIADDDAATRRVTSELLRVEDDLEVVGTAATAAEAVAEAERLEPDLALLDVRMPGGGGPAAARAIARVSPATRVVALSGFDDPGTVRSMLRAGAVSYAVKGGDPAELMQVLRRAATMAPGVPAPPAEAVPGAEAPIAAIRVLLVDGDAEILRALADVVERSPQLELVGLAQTASHAVRLAARHQPDVALLAAGLPSGGGERTATEIADASPGTRIIAHSAHRDTETAIGMLRAGATSFVVSDGDAETLMEALVHAARGTALFDFDAARAIIGRLDLALTTNGGRSGGDRRRRQIERMLEPGMLDVALQPIFRFGDAVPEGYEALARFPEGTGGPDVWFAEAERVGLGLELELAAVGRALEVLEHVPSSAFLSINVSPATVLADGLEERLAGAPTHRIVLEITEHAPVADYDSLGRRLAALRERGFRIAVDDCGAGFASLQHVARLAPDFLKLDMVVGREVSSPAQTAMARALVGFGNEMGATVIAEGVERAEDRDALIGLGVPLGQGWLLAEPRLVTRADAGVAPARGSTS